MTIWRLKVDGHPAPKGSLRCVGGRGRVKHQLIEEDSAGNRERWRATLTAAAAGLADRLPNQGQDGVIVGYLALVERPASAPTRPLPTTRSAGDVDKHLRMGLDSLDDAQVFYDDSRVVLAIAAKAYATSSPGAIVYIAPIDEDPHRILSAILNTAPELSGPATLI